MEIVLKAVTRRVRRKVERDFYWYDRHNKKMIHQRAGEMRFEYKPELQQSVPVFLEAEDWVVENDFPKLLEWAKRHPSVEITGHAVNHYVSIEVPNTLVEDVIEQLTRNRFLFDY